MNVCFAKLSVLVLLWTVSPFRLHHGIALVIGAIIIVWALTSEFVAAFRCRIPDTWALLRNNCINHVSPPILTPSAVLRLLTEYRTLFGLILV